MKKYNVNVNGKTYQIEIEEVENFDPKKAQTLSTPAAPAADPTPAQAPAAAPAAGGNTVSCPMPGTILDVRCSEGATVKKGDILFILEAMKMENEIMSPCDGTVRGVSVSKGASVDTGAVLCTIA